MEAGKTVADRRRRPLEARPDRRDDRRRPTTRSPTSSSATIERSACPTCGSCSGMFTANSMNCLTEAIGLALPGNGSTLATHAARKALFDEGRPRSSSTSPSATTTATTSRCCRARSPAADGVRERDGARRRDGRLDQHGPAPARRRPRGRARLRRRRHRRDLPPGALPVQGRAEHARSTTWRTCTGPAASPPSSASSTAAACCTATCTPCTRPTLDEWLADLGHPRRLADRRGASSCSTPRPGGVRTTEPFSHRPTAGRRWTPTRPSGCIRDVDARLHRRRRPGRPVRQPRAGRLRGEDRRRADE